MLKARGLAFVLVAASALGCAAACTTDTTTQNGNANTANSNGATTGTAGTYQHKTKKQGEPVYIGFSMDTIQEERWQRDKALVESRAKEVGARLDVAVANGNDALQTNQCDDLLTKGVDVLIIAPHNSEIAASAVEKAHAKGVPVISYDRLIKSSDVDLYV